MSNVYAGPPRGVKGDKIDINALTDLTVGKLRALIADLPDDVPCGVIDHYGHFKGFDYVPEAQKRIKITESSPARIKRALVFQAIDIGPEPD